MKKLLVQFFKFYTLLIFVIVLIILYFSIKENQIYDLNFEKFSKRYNDKLYKKLVIYNLSNNSSNNFKKIHSFLINFKKELDLNNFQDISVEFYEESVLFNRFILLYKNKDNNTLDGIFERENPTLLIRYILKCKSCNRNSSNYIVPPYIVIYDKRVMVNGSKGNNESLIIKECENGRLIIMNN